MCSNSKLVCSHIASSRPNREELYLIETIRRLLVETRGPDRRAQKTLVNLIENIALNSKSDLKTIWDSEIINNVCLAFMIYEDEDLTKAVADFIITLLNRMMIDK